MFFTLRSGTRQGYALSLLLSNIVFKVLASVIMKNKLQFVKEEKNTCIYRRDFPNWNFKEFTKELLKLLRAFNKDKVPNSTLFLHTRNQQL